MIFLGIDGGGSKTACLVGDEGSVLGSGSSSGSNLVRVGEGKAREALASAIRQACGVAGITPGQINRTCIGLAGTAQPEVSAVVRRLIAEVVSGEIQIVGDMVIALEAAFGGGPGVIVIAGTGSIAYGRNSQGQTARAGGWGHAVSDEGSGHWIGRAAVAAALRASDENESDAPASALLAGIMKFWSMETRGQLVLAANASPSPDFAALLPAVLSAADSGDNNARDILARAGAELGNLAAMVIRRLFPGESVVPVAMSGGVFRNSPLVCQAFYNSLHLVSPAAQVKAQVIEPVRGALELARKGSPPGDSKEHSRDAS